MGPARVEVGTEEALVISVFISEMSIPHLPLVKTIQFSTPISKVSLCKNVSPQFSSSPSLSHRIVLHFHSNASQYFAVTYVNV